MICRIEFIRSIQAPTIQDFSIIKMISRGGFGKVYLGFKTSDPTKLYAIKVNKKSPSFNRVINLCSKLFPLCFIVTENAKVWNGQQEYDIASDNRTKCVGVVGQSILCAFILFTAIVVFRLFGKYLNHCQRIRKSITLNVDVCTYFFRLWNIWLAVIWNRCLQFLAILTSRPLNSIALR